MRGWLPYVLNDLIWGVFSLARYVELFGHCPDVVDSNAASDNGMHK